MDFVLSKVCMAVSALVVLSVLSGLWASDSGLSPVSELEGILGDLCRSIDILARAGAPGEFLWEVPYMSSGEHISVEVFGTALKAESAGRSVMASPSVRLQTWTWSGQELNESEVAGMDSASEILRALSSSTLRVSASAVQVSGVVRLGILVSLAG